MPSWNEFKEGFKDTFWRARRTTEEMQLLAPGGVLPDAFPVADEAPELRYTFKTVTPGLPGSPSFVPPDFDPLNPYVIYIIEPWIREEIVGSNQEIAYILRSPTAPYDIVRGTIPESEVRNLVHRTGFKTGNPVEVLMSVLSEDEETTSRLLRSAALPIPFLNSFLPIGWITPGWTPGDPADRTTIQLFRAQLRRWFFEGVNYEVGGIDPNKSFKGITTRDPKHLLPPELPSRVELNFTKALAALPDEASRTNPAEIRKVVVAEYNKVLRRKLVDLMYLEDITELKNAITKTDKDFESDAVDRKENDYYKKIGQIFKHFTLMAGKAVTLGPPEDDAEYFYQLLTDVPVDTAFNFTQKLLTTRDAPVLNNLFTKWSVVGANFAGLQTALGHPAIPITNQQELLNALIHSYDPGNGAQVVAIRAFLDNPAHSEFERQTIREQYEVINRAHGLYKYAKFGKDYYVEPNKSVDIFDAVYDDLVDTVKDIPDRVDPALLPYAEAIIRTRDAITANHYHIIPAKDNEFLHVLGQQLNPTLTTAEQQVAYAEKAIHNLAATADDAEFAAKMYLFTQPPTLRQALVDLKAHAESSPANRAGLIEFLGIAPTTRLTEELLAEELWKIAHAQPLDLQELNDYMGTLPQSLRGQLGQTVTDIGALIQKDITQFRDPLALGQKFLSMTPADGAQTRAKVVNNEDHKKAGEEITATVDNVAALNFKQELLQCVQKARVELEHELRKMDSLPKPWNADREAKRKELIRCIAHTVGAEGNLKLGLTGIAESERFLLQRHPECSVRRDKDGKLVKAFSTTRQDKNNLFRTMNVDQDGNEYLVDVSNGSFFTGLTWGKILQGEGFDTKDVWDSVLTCRRAIAEGGGYTRSATDEYGRFETMAESLWSTSAEQYNSVRGSDTGVSVGNLFFGFIYGLLFLAECMVTVPLYTAKSSLEAGELTLPSMRDLLKGGAFGDIVEKSLISAKAVQEQRLQEKVMRYCQGKREAQYMSQVFVERAWLREFAAEIDDRNSGAYGRDAKKMIKEVDDRLDNAARTLAIASGVDPLDYGQADPNNFMKKDATGKMEDTREKITIVDPATGQAQTQKQLQDSWKAQLTLQNSGESTESLKTLEKLTRKGAEERLLRLKTRLDLLQVRQEEGEEGKSILLLFIRFALLPIPLRGDDNAERMKNSS